MLKKNLCFGIVAVALVVLSACDGSGNTTSAPTDFESGILQQLVDSRDGKTYKTVVIGTQTWMAENLNYESPNSYCYNNDVAFCTKYGRLYTWTAARTVCPSGWRLPGKADWETLFSAVGGMATAGPQLKSTSGWIYSGNGTDAFGFSAFPAGYTSGGNYYHEGDYANFWSSSEYDSNSAYYMNLDLSFKDAYLGNSNKDDGFSVRCLKSSTERLSSSQKIESSSSAVVFASKCKTDQADKCVYAEVTDSRDGQSYKTVVIGSQIWMAQNLNYEADNSYCYNNDASNCAKYGRLYTWATAVGKSESECGYGKKCTLPSGNIQGICPNGWHLPSKTEWQTLFTMVGGPLDTIKAGNNVATFGGEYTAGKVLKSSSEWEGSDAFGFSALPGGFRSIRDVTGDEVFSFGGSFAYFWSTSDDFGSHAYCMELDFLDAARLPSNDKNYWFSVRCLKGEGEKPESSPSTLVRSSSSVALVSPCKTDLADACVYGELTDSRDGQTYRTVTIGSQMWMAQNLNYETDNSYCYEDSVEYCVRYGRLYTWAAAMDSVGAWSPNGKDCGEGTECSPIHPVRGVCPEGWHIPSMAEWKILFTAVGGQLTAGDALKSMSDWNSGGNGTDAFGFSALPACSRGTYDYSDMGYAHFWSASEETSSLAYNMGLFYLNDDASLNYTAERYGLSVRCIKD